MNSKLKIISFYSESHKDLYEKYFYPSASKWYDVVPELQEQKGDGTFNDKYFSYMMKRKIEIILANGFNKNLGKDWFVFSDCDVMFFRDFESDMQRRINEFDIVAQSDCGGICAGFMAIKKNKITEKFFNLVLEYMEKDPRMDAGQGFHDQQAINELVGIIWTGKIYSPEVQRPKYSLVKYFDGYANFDHLVPGKQWNDGMDIPLKFIPYMWHANFTIGIQNKLKMFEQIKNKINLMNKNI